MLLQVSERRGVAKAADAQAVVSAGQSSDGVLELLIVVDTFVCRSGVAMCG